MIFWRISAFPDLSGLGGLLAQGRWHHAGRPIVYLAETPAGAMLEILVHLEIDLEDIPENLRLMNVSVPDPVVTYREISSLPPDWEEKANETRGIGDAWLASGESLLLKVPSAIMPHTHNWLLNPAHPTASQVTFFVETLRLDKRLLKGLYEK